jgi:hypothetical protein
MIYKSFYKLKKTIIGPIIGAITFFIFITLIIFVFLFHQINNLYEEITFDLNEFKVKYFFFFQIKII